ncbi:hypothetical protein DL93DRAFT_2171679 [Clavulina sp. PMI_390]|nr:hypothetical protein DL93DRAFT_2171679 [Clavulina sp. PMI_390]
MDPQARLIRVTRRLRDVIESRFSSSAFNGLCDFLNQAQGNHQQLNELVDRVEKLATSIVSFGSESNSRGQSRRYTVAAGRSWIWWDYESLPAPLQSTSDLFNSTIERFRDVIQSVDAELRSVIPIGSSKLQWLFKAKEIKMVLGHCIRRLDIAIAECSLNGALTAVNEVRELRQEISRPYPPPLLASVAVC